MSIREANSIRVLSNGNSFKDIQKNRLINTIKNNFTESPSYFEVFFNNSSNSTGVQIVDSSSNANINNEDVKTVIMKPSEIIKTGDIIKWETNIWMCISCKIFNDIYWKGEIIKTNNVLHCILPNGMKVSLPVVIEEASRNSMLVDETDKLEMQKIAYAVYIQKNDISMSIEPSLRLKFGKMSYRVIAIDDITMDGIIKLKIETDLNRPLDDEINQIADNEVAEIPTPTGLLLLDGENSIKLNTQNTYSIVYDNNNVASGQYNFTITDLDGNSTDVANIVSTTDTSCTIQSNKLGYFKLKANYYIRTLQDVRNSQVPNPTKTYNPISLELVPINTFASLNTGKTSLTQMDGLVVAGDGYYYSDYDIDNMGTVLEKNIQIKGIF